MVSNIIIYTSGKIQHQEGVLLAKGKLAGVFIYLKYDKFHSRIISL